MRMNRWAKAGVLDRVFKRLRQERLIRIKVETVSLDSTVVKVHPDGTGALKKGAYIRECLDHPGLSLPPAIIGDRCLPR